MGETHKSLSSSILKKCPRAPDQKSVREGGACSARQADCSNTDWVFDIDDFDIGERLPESPALVFFGETRKKQHQRQSTRRQRVETLRKSIQAKKETLSKWREE